MGRGRFAATETLITKIKLFGEQKGYHVTITTNSNGVYVEGTKQINGGEERVNLYAMYMLSI